MEGQSAWAGRAAGGQSRGRAGLGARAQGAGWGGAGPGGGELEQAPRPRPGHVTEPAAAPAADGRALAPEALFHQLASSWINFL